MNNTENTTQTKNSGETKEIRRQSRPFCGLHSIAPLFCAAKPDVPKKAKMVIIGALGYFILPTDFIPDFAVGIGFTDDFGALGLALIQVAMYIDDDVKAQARAKLQDWFGEDVDTSEVDGKL